MQAVMDASKTHPKDQMPLPESGRKAEESHRTKASRAMKPLENAIPFYVVFRGAGRGTLSVKPWPIASQISQLYCVVFVADIRRSWPGTQARFAGDLPQICALRNPPPPPPKGAKLRGFGW